MELRASEDRMHELHAEVELWRDRAARAEQWLRIIQQEIKEKLLAPKSSFDAEQKSLSESPRPVPDFAAQRRLPAIYEARKFVGAGGLVSYGPSLPVLQRRAADYVNMIFKGAKPGDIPVEQPTKFELIINLKTARALGLVIPPTVLERSDELIDN